MAEGWDDRTKALIKATVGKGLSNAALALLEHNSVSRGLDPLAGELIAYDSKGRTTMITTINGMLKLCADQLDGIDAQWFDGDGNSYPVWLPDIPPAACNASVWRKGCARSFNAAARFKDYKGNGRPWQQMPSTMIRKCAIAAALRLAFGDLLAGLYVAEEMEQAGFSTPVPAEPEQVKAVPERVAEVRSEVKQQQSEQTPEEPASAPADVLPETPDDEWKVNAPTTKKFYARCRELGMTSIGWRTLDRQIGGIGPEVAHGLMSKITSDKVALLNSGKPTTSQAPVPT